MADRRVYMTAEGLNNLEQQIQELRTVKRPAALQHLIEVSGGADWRESTEQFFAQEALDRVDAEMLRLEEMLANAQVVEPQSGDTIVDIGETVVLQSDDQLETYTIVGPTESDPDEGRISYESPVGHALLRHKVGDEVDVEVPVGTIRYRIVAVQ